MWRSYDENILIHQNGKVLKGLKSEIEGHSVNAKDKKNALAGEPTHIMCLKCAWFEKKCPKWLGASK